MSDTIDDIPENHPFDRENNNYTYAKDMTSYVMLQHLELGEESFRKGEWLFGRPELPNLHIELLDNNPEYKALMNKVLADKDYIQENCYGSNLDTYTHDDVEKIRAVLLQGYIDRYIEVYDDVSVDPSEGITAEAYHEMLDMLSYNSSPVSENRLKHHFGNAARKHLKLLDENKKYRKLFNKICLDNCPNPYNVNIECYKNKEPAWKTNIKVAYAWACYGLYEKFKEKREKTLVEIALTP